MDLRSEHGGGRETRIRTAWHAAAVLACLALPGAAAEAQDARVLSLADALDLASRHNPEYRQALNDIGLGDAAGRQAWGAFLPTLSVSTSTDQSFYRRELAIDDFGNPVANPDTRTSYTSATGQSLGMSLTLFEGGRRFADLSRVRGEADARRRTAEARLQTLRAGVEREFFQTQQQAELLRIERELQDARVRDVEATRRLFALASRSRADLLGAEFELRQQERTVQEVEGAYRKALLALRTLIGEPGLVTFELAEEPTATFDPRALDVAALVTAALSGNPAVARERASVDVSRASVSAARALRWPTLSLSGQLGRSAFGPDQTALFSVNPDDQAFGSLTLSVSVPIFRGFTTSYSIAEADVDFQNAAESLRRVELETEERVRAGLIDLESAHAALRIQAQALAVAEERLRIAREEYRLAGRDFEGLQTAVRDAATARRQELEARYAFVQARIDLEEVVGAPVRVAEPEGAPDR